jgi:hypothetical protein
MLQIAKIHDSLPEVVTWTAHDPQCYSINIIVSMIFFYHIDASSNAGTHRRSPSFGDE